jgi:hypothetical protein
MTVRPPWMSVDGADVVVRVKAVPGASRDAIAGPLGDRLKVRVAAPPEGGKANDAIAALLAAACGVPVRAVALEAGPAQAQKTFRLRGAQAERVASIGS